MVSTSYNLLGSMASLEHIAVIMDGNRRWAKERDLPTLEGHRAGVDALQKLVKAAPSHGIKYITAYAFSTENWKRSEQEKGFIFGLLKEVALRELSNLFDSNVKVTYLGDLSLFSEDIRASLNKLEEKTKDNDGLHLQIALNYGSMDELCHALKSIKRDLNEEEIRDLDEKTFSQFLYSRAVPDPDLLIRTGGCKRLSNYLLWQSVYSQLEFVDELWPDFDEALLKQVITEYKAKETKAKRAKKLIAH